MCHVPVTLLCQYRANISEKITKRSNTSVILGAISAKHYTILSVLCKSKKNHMNCCYFIGIGTKVVKVILI